jgi:uncharacterized protein YprB with RNaseH-like and TPR domain
MSDLQEQLAILRQRISRVADQCDRKYAGRPPLLGEMPEVFDDQPVLPRPPMQYIEEWLSGEEVETSLGKHFETEKLYESHRHHGSSDIGALCDLPADLLDILCSNAVPNSSPSEWAFLDTETTGLAGGTGTCAFLVGVGRITPEGFRVRQFFMRDYGEEASQLDALSRHLAPFRVLITYNGRAFDQPLLETRYRLNRARPPFARMEHLDLLHGARRLWKLRFDSCRLVDLENQILGVERHGDLPGALIPYVYFEYLRTRQAARLLPVFQHNATDILTLACLTGIVPYAFKDPSTAPLRHGAEMAGIARWLRQAGELEQALALFRRAIDAGLRDELLFRTLWDAAMLERKMGAAGAALATLTDLSASRNPFRVRALEELAKHYEHQEKNYPRALDFTREALDHEDSPELRKREERLSRRCTRTPVPKKRRSSQARAEA